MRIQHDPEPLLPLARVHAGVHWGGGGTLGVRANEGVDKGVNSYEFARHSHEIRAKFVRNLCEIHVKLYELWGAAKEGWPRNPPPNAMVVHR